MTFNKKVIHVLILMLILFCGVVLYFSYFQIFKSPDLAGKSGNPRTYVREQSIRRGSIYDRHGDVLAESEMHENGQTRSYPYGKVYSQLIGYSDTRYGRFLLEDTYNRYLLGGGADGDLLGTLLGADTNEGADLYLTVDHSLQSLASRQLAGRRGAIAALDPATGEVLCMVSNPSFDPNTLAKDYETLAGTEGMFYPRATNWNYVPGSVFKIITAAAAVENGMENMEYDDTGTFLVDGHEIHNYNNKVYGHLDLETAFAKSSNTYFACLADSLGADALRKTAESFGFNRDILFDIPLRKSTTLTGSPSATQVAAVGYGQGETLTTPLHMAMVAAAIANDGVMMEPYLVQRAEREGQVLYRKTDSVLSRSVSATTARAVEDMMIKCVESGTGTGAKISGVDVAAKTGTAEVGESGKDHAWFVAYAPADNPQIALAIVLENAGTTGSACAGMARNLILECLK